MYGDRGIVIGSGRVVRPVSEETKVVETHGQDEEEAPTTTTTTSQESVTQYPKRKRRAVLLSKFHREMYIRVNHSNRGENNNNNNKQNPDCTRFSLNYIMDYCRSLSTSSSSIGAVALSLSTTAACCYWLISPGPGF